MSYILSGYGCKDSDFAIFHRFCIIVGVAKIKKLAFEKSQESISAAEVAEMLKEEGF